MLRWFGIKTSYLKTNLDYITRFDSERIFLLQKCVPSPGFLLETGNPNSETCIPIAI